MNEITIIMRRAGVTQAEWCRRNKVSLRYLRAIISGDRGKCQYGEAGRIIKALKADGFWKGKRSKSAR